MLNFLFPLARRGGEVDVWYAPDYRWPLPELEASGSGMGRRADLAVWYLAQAGVLPSGKLHLPHRISYRRLALVHDEKWLEALNDPHTLARIFSVDAWDLQVDEVMNTVRMGAGGTLGATRLTLETGRPQLNLLGGFHHAGKSRGGGFCAINDIAIAVASVRALGFNGKVGILDLDAHPPDGTADCFAGDPNVWMGSLSGSDWGPIPGVDEVRVPPKSGDGRYLHDLGQLLRRMPKCELYFVLAGGDVLDGDPLGVLALTLRGARQRDSLVEERIRGTPSVWLPAGGYHRDSWKVLAGTGLVLAGRPGHRIPRRYDPMSRRFAEIAREVPTGLLSDQDPDALFSQDELDELLGGVRSRGPRLLGFYTAQGVEFALYRYGFLEQLRRLGYHRFRIELSHTDTGDRMQLTADGDGKRHLLVDLVVAVKELHGHRFLFVNWLTLRNPRARFTESRPPLPGQEVPGLGMSREAGELLGVIAWRLGLAGVAFRPSWYHVAYAARSAMRFTDPGRQGRFEALIRDTRERPLLEVTQDVAEGRMRMNGVPYVWEADDMVMWRDPEMAKADRAEIEAERDRVKFELAEPPPKQE